MITFDAILPALSAALSEQSGNLAKIDRLVINRDLNGIIRLVVGEQNAVDKSAINAIVQAFGVALGSRLAVTNPVIYESSLDEVIYNASHFNLADFPNVIVADRMLTASDWTNIALPQTGAPRIVFYSIKGGVGRSTALAATAWALAEEGKRVLVLDLDLESPGISSSLLPKEKRPMYGIADWLVEDLVNNGDAVFPYMMGSSELAHNGEINVIPAHGLDPGEYITKLGRVWMAREYGNGQTIFSSEPWYKRLNRLLVSLEYRYKPDVVLIDSRAGIDEVSAACITALEAERILLFALDSDQTWTGYDILFNHWLRCGAVRNIRERLQIVGALIPDDDQRHKYFDGLCEHSYNLFTKSLYDEVPAGEPAVDYFCYDKPAIEAPHYPWPVLWNRGFSAQQNHYTFLQSENGGQVSGVFGGLINGIKGLIENG